MRNIAILLFSCFLSLSGYAQKVKYKKGTISVDKVQKYEVIKLKKKGIGNPRTFTLKEINGHDILIIKDTTLVLTQLPFEKSPRRYLLVQRVTAPQLHKTNLVPLIGALNFGKLLSKDLQKLGFFKEATLSEDIYAQYIKNHNVSEVAKILSAIDTLNKYRTENYERTVELFGEISPRTPGIISISGDEILENGKTIGHFKFDKKGSYAQIYIIINQANDVIGGFTIIPSEGRANIRMQIHEYGSKKQAQWIRFKRDPHGSDLTVEDKMQKAAEFLVYNGYL